MGNELYIKGALRSFEAAIKTENKTLRKRQDLEVLITLGDGEEEATYFRLTVVPMVKNPIIGQWEELNINGEQE